MTVAASSPSRNLAPSIPGGGETKKKTSKRTHHTEGQATVLPSPSQPRAGPADPPRDPGLPVDLERNERRERRGRERGGSRRRKRRRRRRVRRRGRRRRRRVSLRHCLRRRGRRRLRHRRGGDQLSRPDDGELPRRPVRYHRRGAKLEICRLRLRPCVRPGREQHDGGRKRRRRGGDGGGGRRRSRRGRQRRAEELELEVNKGAPRSRDRDRGWQLPRVLPLSGASRRLRGGAA